MTSQTAATAPTRPRVILITGATGPLGRAAAAAFAADGARLGLAGTDRGRLDALAAELGLPTEQWVAGVGDLTTADGVAAAIGAVRERFGPIAVLLHLVGGWTGGTALVDLDPEILGGMLGQHVWSTFHVARAVAPDMTERGWGRIVAVSSTTVTSPGPRVTAYTAAKAAQETILRGLAREVAGAGVTVNVLAVKAIDAAHEREADPTPRNAGTTTPEEIVEVIRFLCSDAGATVNGARIVLEGRG